MNIPKPVPPAGFKYDKVGRGNCANGVKIGDTIEEVDTVAACTDLCDKNKLCTAYDYSGRDTSCNIWKGTIVAGDDQNDTVCHDINKNTWTAGSCKPKDNKINSERKATLDECIQYTKDQGGSFAEYTSGHMDCYAFKGPSSGDAQDYPLCYIKKEQITTPPVTLKPS